MKILLVDDEPVNVQSLANAIRRGGHEIHTLSDPRQALDVYRDDPFDVVISDVRMPGMNGVELLKSLRELDPSSRVILITGYGDAKTAMSAINNRAWALLAKPISVTSMMDMLQTIEKEIAEKNRLQQKTRKLAEKYAELNERFEESEEPPAGGTPGTEQGNGTSYSRNIH